MFLRLLFTVTLFSFMWLSWRLGLVASEVIGELRDPETISSGYALHFAQNSEAWLHREVRARSDSYACNLFRTTSNCRQDCAGNLTHVGIVDSAFYFGVNGATECKSRCHLDYANLKKQNTTATLSVNATFIQQTEKGPTSGELSALCETKNQPSTNIVLFYFDQNLASDKGSPLLLNITAPVTSQTFPDKANGCTFKVFVAGNFCFSWYASIKH